jgi:hypothetical protein
LCLWIESKDSYLPIFILYPDLEMILVLRYVSHYPSAVMHLSLFAFGLHVIDLFCTVIRISLDVILVILSMQYGIDEHSKTIESLRVPK